MWLELFTDPEVTRFLPPGPTPTPDMFPGILARRHAMERERGHAMWVVDVKASGSPIGQCGLYPAASTGPEIELAYQYLPSAWGKGYATEAATAVLRYGLGPVGLEQIIALVIPQNLASSRVLDKAGMRLEADPATYYELPGLRKYVAQRDWWRPPEITSRDGQELL